MWWFKPLIPAVEGQRQAALWTQGQYDIHSEFQASQEYTVRPWLRGERKENEKKSWFVQRITRLTNSLFNRKKKNPIRKLKKQRDTSQQMSTKLK